MQLYSVAAANGVSIFDVDTAAGAIRIAFAVPGTVTDGTLKIEYKFSGSDRWRQYTYGPPNGGALRIADANSVDAAIIGDITQIRLTQAGIVGTGIIVVAIYDENSLVLLPQMFTDRGGRNSRLRVDEGSTGFYAGREFRIPIELNIPAGGTFWVRHTIGVNFMLHEQRLTLETGGIRWSAVAATTTSPGPWTAATFRRRNQMSEQPLPMYTSASTIETSTDPNAATGGIEVDIMRLNAGTGGQSASVQQNAGVRGLAAGVYHAKLFNTSNQPAVGVYDWWWEERP